MSIIKTEMPIMARNEGEWSGCYTLVAHLKSQLSKVHAWQKLTE